ncbi:MAG: pyrimidine-nucleoside phosphorylase, partial [Filifactor alocis]|nr:pyrimidine-nucleoside phosphorylase [Filifactor alocis]
MRAIDVIYKKRNGGSLSEEEIRFFVEGFTKGDIPDYQASALMMAIYFNHMNKEETLSLVKAMVDSGDTMDLSRIKGIKCDKHSTGGVGDKTTIVLAPLVAYFGVPVAKMSGRGLGHTGGTLDKLEAIPGFSIDLSEERFIENVNRHGIAVAGQTGELVPADKKLYALRDVTATVENTSLIAASIMSKKLASGADKIVLDVKTGKGAFMKTTEDSLELAKAMVEIGTMYGRQTLALITDMNEPLGNAVGNSLEVIEAIETLKGRGPEDLTKLCVELAIHMLLLSERFETYQEAKTAVEDAVFNKKALDKLKEFIEIQGGDPRVTEDYALLPLGRKEEVVVSEKEGYVDDIDAEQIGHCAMLLGAGRKTKDDDIDLGAGLILHKKTGDFVKRGDALATL